MRSYARRRAPIRGIFRILARLGGGQSRLVLPPPVHAHHELQGGGGRPPPRPCGSRTRRWKTIARSCSARDRPLYPGLRGHLRLLCLLCLVFGVPTAYAHRVREAARTPETLFFWFLSTTLLPPVAVIVPVFLLFRSPASAGHPGRHDPHLHRLNIPIVIWMTRSFLLDVPREILESRHRRLLPPPLVLQHHPAPGAQGIISTGPCSCSSSCGTSSSSPSI